VIFQQSPDGRNYSPIDDGCTTFKRTMEVSSWPVAPFQCCAATTPLLWSLMGMTVAQTPWLANSGLLCRGRHRMGTASDADHQLDGATGRLGQLNQGAY